MRSITRIYTRDGSLLEEASVLDLGKIVTSSSREPQIVSLHVDNVAAISAISLRVVASQNIDIAEGFLQYYTSNEIIESFDNIQKKTFSLNEPIYVKNKTLTDSEYIYIWIDPQKIIPVKQGSVKQSSSSSSSSSLSSSHTASEVSTNIFNFRFEWNFDYIQSSSSSCSSSSCSVGEFYLIETFEERSFGVADCESICFEFNLDIGEYASVSLDSDSFVVENNGGIMIINDVSFFSDDVYYLFTVGSNQYLAHVIDVSQFFVCFYRLGDCSPDAHLLLTTGGDFLLVDGARLLFLSDFTPYDALLLTGGGELYFVDGSIFALASSSSSSSSLSSSSSSSSV